MKRNKEQPFTLAAPVIRRFLRKYGASVRYLESRGISRSSIMAFRRGDVVSLETFIRILAAVRHLAVGGESLPERREYHKDLTCLLELLIRLSRYTHYI